MVDACCIFVGTYIPDPRGSITVNNLEAGHVAEFWQCMDESITVHQHNVVRHHSATLHIALCHVARQTFLTK